MSSARDITRSAWPARSVYLDYPLGHTAGQPNKPQLNEAIMRDTLAAFESLSEPGSMAHLPYRWADTDDWKDKVFAQVICKLLRSPATDPTMSAQTAIMQDEAYLETANYHLGPPR